MGGTMTKSIFCLICLVILVMPVMGNGQNLLSGPEHATYDIVNDRYIISNWTNGALVIIDNEGNHSYFAYGLGHAYGNHIVGDTLYASTGTSIRAYDLNTATLLYSQAIPYANKIDGIAHDNAGYLYLVDFQANGDSRIFKYNISDRSSEVFVNANDLPEKSQDIIYDEVNDRLLVASYDNNAPLRAINPTSGYVSTVVVTPFGYHDGIAMDNDGNVYLTCYSAGTVYRYDNTFTNPPVLISDGHSGPAGLGYNPTENILVVPNYGFNRVDLISLVDTDSDAIIDSRDNCVNTPNFDQIDTDDDGDGDACDGCPDVSNPGHEDADLDGVEDACDNCPEHANPGQEDSNGNDVGDLCDYV
ncbi:MAG: hypothetical protein GY865_06000, partial [candidate division Zixibacteria bacterium]|nr:hypothetical protein [candidate division Zixibacteria bacterium]